MLVINTIIATVVSLWSCLLSPSVVEGAAGGTVPSAATVAAATGVVECPALLLVLADVVHELIGEIFYIQIVFLRNRCISSHGISV